jgi:hypothetical protein
MSRAKSKNEVRNHLSTCQGICSLANTTKQTTCLDGEAANELWDQPKLDHVSRLSNLHGFAVRSGVIMRLCDRRAKADRLLFQDHDNT